MNTQRLTIAREEMLLAMVRLVERLRREGDNIRADLILAETAKLAGEWDAKCIPGIPESFASGEKLKG